MGADSEWRNLKICRLFLGEESPEFCAKRWREFLWLAQLSQGQLQDEDEEKEWRARNAELFQLSRAQLDPGAESVCRGLGQGRSWCSCGSWHSQERKMEHGKDLMDCPAWSSDLTPVEEFVPSAVPPTLQPGMEANIFGVSWCLGSINSECSSRPSSCSCRWGAVNSSSTSLPVFASKTSICIPVNIGVTQRKLSREATFKHILRAQSSIQRSDKARIEAFFFFRTIGIFFSFSVLVNFGCILRF